MQSPKLIFENSKHTKEEWLEQRLKGIGGSEIASILGYNPYKSKYQVWYDKTQESFKEKEDNNFMFWGRKLESVLFEHFAETEELELEYHDCMYQHHNIKYAFANVDGIIKSHPNKDFVGKGVFEAKTVNAFDKHDWDKSAPVQYVLQLQWYMFVMGLEWGAIACLKGGNNYSRHYYKRDQVVIDTMIEEASLFWQLVESKTPPPVDGSAEAGKFLDKYFSNDDGEDIEAKPDHYPLAVRWLDAENIIKEQKKIVEKCKNELKDYMKEKRNLIFDDGSKVIWFHSARNSIDMKKLESEYPEAYKSTLKVSESRQMRKYFK